LLVNFTLNFYLFSTKTVDAFSQVIDFGKERVLDARRGDDVFYEKFKENAGLPVRSVLPKEVTMEEFHFPKLDLHLHLDGSILPETTWELAHAQGISVPGGSIEGYRSYLHTAANCGSVNEYLKLFDLPLQIMQDRESITRITRELIELLARQGLAYAEIRFAPQLHTQRGLSQQDAVEAVLEGHRQGLAACPNIGIGIIVCMMCIGPETANWSANEETAALAKAYLGRGVAAADLAGAEGIVPLRNFAPLFERLSRDGVPFTCHAGDSQGPDTVRDALDFGARRIGHGHHIFDDPELCRRAIREGVTLEICPTSNIQCVTQPSYQAHPAKKLLDMGMHVTINTDNMVLAGVCLDDEYAHCLQEMGFTRDDLIRMNEYAAEAAFLPEAEKRALVEKLKKYE
jgi:adenosine deaminase